MSETPDRKNKIIAQILKLTKGDVDANLDKLVEKDEKYLIKYLKVVKGLK